jgi:hypothetical protein
MTEGEHEFDDPALRAAVRRAVGEESAPPSLRAKVAFVMSSAAAAEAASPDTSPSIAAPARRGGRVLINRTRLRNVAAAACVVIAFGFLAWQVRQEFFPASPYRGIGTGPDIASIPAETVLDVLRAHDRCAKLADHHLIPGGTPEVVRDTLTRQGGVNAVATSLDAGWEFKGAGLCQVGNARAAHLLFVRRDEYVSIFSLAAPDDCGHGGGCYRDTVENHPVAGFRRGSALYCIVGSGPNGSFTMSELDPIVRKVQESVVAGRLTHDGAVAVALHFGHRD